eukprot:TRINITY_DN9330_c0_g1_i13.p4 TRINITY_DN9330_c0_g1~~TRINITY_DN9330_c0_g1_i13.p4  ORF type:complete len:123 (+),score=46.86 TRINITY_DN9330_c0_g1_i13:1331-1699(+)
MTLHEFFDFFFTALGLLKRRIALELFNQEGAAELTESAVELLKELYSQDVELHKQLVMPLDKSFVFAVPSYEELRKQMAIFFCPLLFNCLGLHAFYEVLSNILLERKVLFISENLNLLSSAV